MILGADRELIHKRVAALLEQAADHYKILIPRPMFNFNGSGTAAGKCKYRKGLITLNHVLWNENREEMLEQTVGHEVAHYVSYLAYGLHGVGHGPRWAEVMDLFGLTPDIFHDMPVDNAVRKRAKGFSWQCDSGHAFTVKGRENLRMIRGVNMGHTIPCPKCAKPLLKK